MLRLFSDGQVLELDFPRPLFIVQGKWDQARCLARGRRDVAAVGLGLIAIRIEHGHVERVGAWPGRTLENDLVA